MIWIWMENDALSEVVGDRAAPYITSLARDCGLATHYDAVAHPSLPNYIAATSGDTQGIADDGPPEEHPLSAVSIFEQAGSAGSYEENMPSNCDLDDTVLYAAKHNPEAFYTRIRKDCARNDVPMGTSSRGRFLAALRQKRLPAFSFVTPNICNDMHSCPLSVGDRWLKRWVPKITSSPSYRSGSTVLFITWDEDDYDHGNRIPMIVVSPFTTPGTRSATPFNHYSLLRTTEDLLGIRTHLGHAASARSMRSAFGL